MTRSAAQTAKRRLQRQTNPSFHLARLPPELQLLVLSKCDLTSIRRLLEVSSSLRSMFLRYPKTTIRDMFADMPSPLGHLLRTVWKFHSNEDYKLDADLTLRVLHSNSLHEWAATLPQNTSSMDKPLESIRTLTAVYEEVTQAAECVAQDMADATEAIVHPHVVTKPIVMSTTEHTRMLCALLLNKIYYWIRKKFPHFGWTDDPEFVASFMRNIEPWQVEQAASIDEYLPASHAVGSRSLTFYTAINAPLDKLDCFHNSKYYQNHRLDWFHGSGPSFTLAARTHYNGYSTSTLWPWSAVTNNELPSLDVLSYTPQLLSPGWTLYASTDGDSIPNRRRYRDLSWYLGLMLWDESRLASWNIIDVDDFKAVVELGDGLASANLADLNRLMPVYSSPQPPEHLAGYNKRETCQIIRWTRSSVQSSLEEFLQEETAPARILDGRQPVPVKYIKAGLQCYECGLEGHNHIRCEEETWSEAEEETGSKAEE
ncbi:hypothetical protein PtrSN002B_002045 [Pyrenophora tritici-repentis]|uniref:Uncharacterized protein n=1 Tax=Pyrenophora tritici-repentis TaxID=45151 RepID=A0A2W1EIV8_9PLEO|nr:hypothetical protein Alg215_01939 [Pyrenophora tritici-repentis]KAI1514335.1 hypothetical protein Ptr86124_006965 [Pyrenophora tritici-repentis]KAI1545325.1 hypothetical protein PtrSN001A_002368 [Pyrenophora tritici-repentis]KAI1556545.1 hypothetical protein PtrSN002B_002045 [Pyrenophora tritici-repentis]KAI1572385.1 hypothetical protein PtrEW7m1_007535 [Pyrenophora tritici-repentis]